MFPLLYRDLAVVYIYILIRASNSGFRVCANIIPVLEGRIWQRNLLAAKKGANFKRIYSKWNIPMKVNSGGSLSRCCDCPRFFIFCNKSPSLVYSCSFAIPAL